MRRVLLPSIVALLRVGVSVTGTTPAGASHTGEVTVSGTVTGIDGTPAGDAVVLVGEDSTLTRFSPDELRELATGDPRNLTVVEAGDDGRFDATLDSGRAEAAVAVSDSGVSDLVYVEVRTRRWRCGCTRRVPRRFTNTWGS